MRGLRDEPGSAGSPLPLEHASRVGSDHHRGLRSGDVRHLPLRQLAGRGGIDRA